MVVILIWSLDFASSDFIFSFIYLSIFKWKFYVKLGSFVG